MTLRKNAYIVAKFRIGSETNQSWCAAGIEAQNQPNGVKGEHSNQHFRVSRRVAMRVEEGGVPKAFVSKASAMRPADLPIRSIRAREPALFPPSVSLHY